MGRAPCCSKVGLHRGPWTPREDALLTNYIQLNGEGNWRSMPKEAGLLRCGKSCRLRWMNYLRPDIKRGNITPDEDDLIIRLHSLLGNRWSLIAGRLPGRTDNEIKNYWNTHLSKKFNTVRDWKKKRKNKSNTNKKPKNKIKKVNLENEKIKIHQPKPVRISTSFSVLPRSESFESSSSRSSHGGYHQHSHNSNFNGVSFFIRDDEDDNGQGHDNNTLDKLYDEYLQLLKTEEDQVMLDSFAESLLI